MDLKLTGGSLAIVSGDLVVADGLDAIAQDVSTRLRMFLGEWFLDTRMGIPFYQRILVKNPSMPDVIAILTKVVKDTAGILSITKGLSYAYNGSDRSLTVSFNANTTSGPLSYANTWSFGGTT